MHVTNENFLTNENLNFNTTKIVFEMNKDLL